MLHEHWTLDHNLPSFLVREDAYQSEAYIHVQRYQDSQDQTSTLSPYYVHWDAAHPCCSNLIPLYNTLGVLA